MWGSNDSLHFCSNQAKNPLSPPAHQMSLNAQMATVFLCLTCATTITTVETSLMSWAAVSQQIFLYNEYFT